ncbi:hypothetical protein PG994_000709 [Apiospora phragmitis]|uniref:Uncharacterized protein n=1 Tax=Apiospora phragmitis TaxID=2905665 RepID=A0ABR1X794_9PEZI
MVWPTCSDALTSPIFNLTSLSSLSLSYSSRLEPPSSISIPSLSVSAERKSVQSGASRKKLRTAEAKAAKSNRILDIQRAAAHPSSQWRATPKDIIGLVTPRVGTGIEAASSIEELVVHVPVGVDDLGQPASQSFSTDTCEIDLARPVFAHDTVGVLGWVEQISFKGASPWRAEVLLGKGFSKIF